jgi:hypothetical protein
MARTPKLRLLREKKRSALQEIAQLEATIAELRSLVSDYEITERVLGSLSDGDDDDIQDEIEIEAKSGEISITRTEAQLEVVRKKPDGIPTAPEMIYEALRHASLRGENGLEPAAMLEFVQKKYWPEAGSSNIGSTAWRLWRVGKLKKSGSIYSLQDERGKSTQNAA